jgi:two-component system phosphate regulon sensor histidine kinase PhoR
MSHEFRTPLTVIRGYAEYLRDAGAPEPAALSQLTGVMLESCDRVIDLVDTLLEVSRIEQGRAAETLQVQELDLEELATQSVDPLMPLAERKEVSVALEFPKERLSLQGDSGLLHQVVRKLVDNAVKYSPPGSQVVVRGRPEAGRSLALEVEDNGIGIAEEHLPRLFDKFYMVDGGIARRGSGTGVGLYLVREIVRLHDGAVGVTSRPGKGSLFAVFLPRCFEAQRPRKGRA